MWVAEKNGTNAKGNKHVLHKMDREMVDHGWQTMEGRG